MPAEGDNALPWFQVIPLILLQFCESFNNSSIYSYVAFLVLDFTDATRDSAGNWAGFVASAVYVGGFLSSYIWGIMSDRFGKRPCLLLGSTGTLICVLMFGFSFNIWWAICVRFLAGILNGNIGVVKSYLAAITNAQNQSRAFSFFFVAIGAGSMAGSSIGGFLARPAVTWPDTFNSTGLFGRFPYLLPNLITAFVVFCGLIGAIFFLPEVKKPSISVVSQDNEDESGVKLDSERADSTGGDAASSDASQSGTEINKLAREKEELVPHNFPPVWRQPQAFLAAFQYTVLGFLYVLFEELVPLWFTSTRASGGLDFSPPQIGLFLLIMGGFFVIVQPTIQYFVLNLGAINCHRLGLLFLLPILMCFPLLNLIAHRPAALWSSLVAIGIVQAFSDSLSFSTVMIMINNSVNSAQFGEVNGMAQTGVALMRALAPVIGGPIFAWSLTEGHKYPFNYWFAFLLQGLLLLVLMALTLGLSPRLNYPADEQPDEGLDFKPLEESDEEVALEDSKLTHKTKSYS